MRILRLLRVVFAIPQVELARRADLSVRELTRIEKGEVQVTKSTLAVIDQAVMDILVERALKEGDTEHVR